MHHAAKTMRGGSRFHKYEENIMNANIDYLGLLTLLRRLLTLELISDSEAKKIAARLRVDMGADIAIFSEFLSFWVWIFSDFNGIVCC